MQLLHARVTELYNHTKGRDCHNTVLVITVYLSQLFVIGHAVVIHLLMCHQETELSLFGPFLSAYTITVN